MIKKPRVLCMDKDPRSLKPLVYLLKTQKYHVFAASTIPKAFDIIRTENQLDIVVFNTTNIWEANTPVSSEDKHEKEFQISTTLREKFPKVPILFVVPLLQRKEIEKFAGIKNSELLFPPYEPSYFLYVVKNGLEGGYLLSGL
jgi:response regulator RpfG family c-di-GMP phosphodiesterase